MTTTTAQRTVAFLGDRGNQDGTIGGAELTMLEFSRAAPAEVVHATTLDAQMVVIGNCATYSKALIPELVGKRIVWFHNDLSPHIDPGLKVWLDENATHVFCSPLQRDRYGLDGELIPPAIDLDRFKKSNGEGMVSIGTWQNPGKGQQSLWEYAERHGPIDIYGTGPFAPTQPPLQFKGAVQYDDVPEVLSQYATFVHLPWDVEPFGRGVVEAWASGLDLVVNDLVGARYWIEQAPEKLHTAAEDFWSLCLS